MEDKEFLRWLYYRLDKVHMEPKNTDYMLKLKAIIDAYPVGKTTPNIQGE